MKKAPLISASPDTDTAKSILPPVNAKKTDSAEAKAENSQIRVIFRPENTARVVERSERPYRDRNDKDSRPDTRDSRGDRPRSDRPRSDRSDKNDKNRGDRRPGDDRPRSKDGGQRRDNPRFQGMDKDKDASQAPRPQRQSKPSSSFRINARL